MNNTCTQAALYILLFNDHKGATGGRQNQNRHHSIVCFFCFFYSSHTVEVEVIKKSGCVSSVLQGPPGRAGLPGADGLPGPPGTMLMLPVSAQNNSLKVHINHFLLHNPLTRLISCVPSNEEPRQNRLSNF